MTLNNNLIILISRLKSASKSKNGMLIVPRTSYNKKVLTCLYTKGYVVSFFLSDDRLHFKVLLKPEMSFFNNLRIVSVPSRRVFLRYEDLVKKYRPYDFFIISSSKGIFLGDEVFFSKVGGELICDSNNFN
jgi:small subunit ribosomal protein S8